MVIGDAFVWGHLPKTGGDATAQLFGLFPELVIQADTREAHEKHATFTQREELVEGKSRALNFRRLPSWILSVSMFQALYGEPPNYAPTPMRSPHEMAGSRLADENLVPFLDRATQIDHWLRMEALAEDFLQFLSHYTDVDDERRELVLTFPPVNAQGYDHVLSHWFSEEDIAQMYDTNPAWAAVERGLYGDLLSMSAEPSAVSG